MRTRKASYLPIAMAVVYVLGFWIMGIFACTYLGLHGFAW